MNVTNIRKAERTPIATWIPNSLMGVISEVTFERKPTMVVVVANNNAEPTNTIEEKLDFSMFQSSTNSSLYLITKCIP